MCSPPLPGSRDAGTTSPGGHTARLRLVQRHASLHHHRLTSILYSSLPPGLSEPEPPNQLLLQPCPVWAGTNALRRPAWRGGAKSKAAPRELCEQRREREISPSSLRSSGLNLHNQLDVPCIGGIPKETMNHPQIEAVDFV